MALRFSYKSLIEEALNQAGVTINGSKPFDIQVHDKRFYRRVFYEHRG